MEGSLLGAEVGVRLRRLSDFCKEHESHIKVPATGEERSSVPLGSFQLSSLGWETGDWPRNPFWPGRNVSFSSVPEEQEEGHTRSFANKIAAREMNAYLGIQIDAVQA